MKKIFICLLVICIVSCASDDNNGTIINEPSLEGLREANIQLLAGNSEKVWRISQATLQNEQDTLNISSNFNVVDDEFVFTNTTIEWREGHEIKYDATTADEAKLDYYVAPESYMYSFEAGSATQFSANTEMNYEIQENGSVTGVIEVGNETELHVMLVPKTAQDYMSTESTSLQFTEAFTVNASLQVFGTGMIGTNSEDGIYIAHRGYYDGQAQRVLKVDLESGLQTEQIVNNYNFTYSKLHVIANQLALVNTQEISLYNPDFSTVPTSYPTNSQISNVGASIIYGTATQGDDIYVVGGNHLVDPARIYKSNVATQTYTEFASLPEARYGADATIVNNVLYVFGGVTDYPAVQPAQNTIYIIPLDDPSNVQTLQMSQNMNVSYVKAYQNLIYVAGITFTGNTVVGITERESHIGVFNTLDNTYQELQHNLTNASGLEAIEEMCIVGDKMYVIYGDMLGQGLQDWSVYAADLN